MAGKSPSPGPLTRGSLSIQSRQPRELWPLFLPVPADTFLSSASGSWGSFASPSGRAMAACEPGCLPREAGLAGTCPPRHWKQAQSVPPQLCALFHPPLGTSELSILSIRKWGELGQHEPARGPGYYSAAGCVCQAPSQQRWWQSHLEGPAYLTWAWHWHMGVNHCLPHQRVPHPVVLSSTSKVTREPDFNPICAPPSPVGAVPSEDFVQ